MRIEPLPAEALPAELQPILDFSRDVMGFTANDVLTMARWPALLQAMQPMVGAIYAPGEVGLGLKRLVGLVVSAAAGCRYCQAHTAHGAAQLPDVGADKIAAVWEFETSELFDARERAALRLARDAGAVPNAVTDEHFKALREHFSDAQILELVGIIALFGFLNRWNDTLATPLEDDPRQFAESAFAAQQWSAGKHGPAQD